MIVFIIAGKPLYRGCKSSFPKPRRVTGGEILSVYYYFIFINDMCGMDDKHKEKICAFF